MPPAIAMGLWYLAAAMLFLGVTDSAVEPIEGSLAQAPATPPPPTVLHMALPGLSFLDGFAVNCKDMLLRDLKAANDIGGPMAGWPVAPVDRLLAAQRMYDLGVLQFNNGASQTAADLLASSLHLQLYPYPSGSDMHAWQAALTVPLPKFISLRVRLAQTLLALARASAHAGHIHDDVTAVDLAYSAADAAGALLHSVADTNIDVGDDSPTLVWGARSPQELLNETLTLLEDLPRQCAVRLVQGDVTSLAVALEVHGKAHLDHEYEKGKVPRILAIERLLSSLRSPLKLHDAQGTGENQADSQQKPSTSVQGGCKEPTLHLSVNVPRFSSHAAERETIGPYNALRAAAVVAAHASPRELLDEIGVSCWLKHVDAPLLKACTDGIHSLWRHALFDDDGSRVRLGAQTRSASLLERAAEAKLALYYLDRTLGPSSSRIDVSKLGLVATSGGQKAFDGKVVVFPWNPNEHVKERIKQHALSMASMKLPSSLSLRKDVGAGATDDDCGAAPDGFDPGQEICIDFGSTQSAITAADVNQLRTIAASMESLYNSLALAGGMHDFWNMMFVAASPLNGQVQSDAPAMASSAMTGAFELSPTSVASFRELAAVLMQRGPADNRGDVGGTNALEDFIAPFVATVVYFFWIMAFAALMAYVVAMRKKSRLRRQRNLAAGIEHRATAAAALREALAASNASKLAAALKVAEDAGAEKPLLKKAKTTLHNLKRRKTSQGDQRPNKQSQVAHQAHSKQSAYSSQHPALSPAMTRLLLRHASNASSSSATMEDGADLGNESDTDWVEVGPNKRSPSSSSSYSAAAAAAAAACTTTTTPSAFTTDDCAPEHPLQERHQKQPRVHSTDSANLPPPQAHVQSVSPVVCLSQPPSTSPLQDPLPLTGKASAVPQSSSSLGSLAPERTPSLQRSSEGSSSVNVITVVRSSSAKKTKTSAASAKATTSTLPRATQSSSQADSKYAAHLQQQQQQQQQQQLANDTKRPGGSRAAPTQSVATPANAWSGGPRARSTENQQQASKPALLRTISAPETAAAKGGPVIIERPTSSGLPHAPKVVLVRRSSLQRLPPPPPPPSPHQARAGKATSNRTTATNGATTTCRNSSSSKAPTKLINNASSSFATTRTAKAKPSSPPSRQESNPIKTPPAIVTYQEPCPAPVSPASALGGPAHSASDVSSPHSNGSDIALAAAWQQAATASAIGSHQRLHPVVPDRSAGVIAPPSKGGGSLPATPTASFQLGISSSAFTGPFSLYGDAFAPDVNAVTKSASAPPPANSMDGASLSPVTSMALGYLPSEATAGSSLGTQTLTTDGSSGNLLASLQHIWGGGSAESAPMTAVASSPLVPQVVPAVGGGTPAAAAFGNSPLVGSLDAGGVQWMAASPAAGSQGLKGSPMDAEVVVASASDEAIAGGSLSSPGVSCLGNSTVGIGLTKRAPSGSLADLGFHEI